MQRKYLAYCASKGTSPLPVTVGNALAWLAQLARSTTLATGTIHAHRNALSTMHATSSFHLLPNPLDHPSIHRLMAGIDNERIPAERKRKAERHTSVALTPTLLAQSMHCLSGPSPREIMLWAAITLGTFGALRPSELLGSPQLKERSLRSTQIVFRAEMGRLTSAVPLADGISPSRSNTPDRYEIQLIATKTNPTGEGATVTIAAPMAVEAMWKWIHLRRSLAIGNDLLFFEPGSGQLFAKPLTQYVERGLRSAGAIGPTQRVTGKTFRRGAATALVASEEVDLVDAALAGRWRPPTIPHAMLNTYADPEARAVRAAQINRALQPRSH